MADLTAPEAEAVIVGSLLVDNEWSKHTAGVVFAEDFTVPLYREIFEEIESAIKAKRLASFRTMREHFADGGKWNGAGGLRVMEDLVAGAVWDLEVAMYAQQVHNLAERRNLVALAHMTQTDAEREQDPQVTLDRLEGRLRSKLTSKVGADWMPKPATLATADLLRPYDASQRLPTGWRSLDEKLRGWPRKKVSVVAARPSMGKSMFGIDAARHQAQAGRGVGFISLEMAHEEIWLRMAADLAFRSASYSASPENNPPHYEAVKAGEASPRQMKQMEAALEVVRSLPIMVDDRAALKVVEMHRWCRKLDRWLRDHGTKLDCVIVDYLQLAKPDKPRNGSRTNEVTDISGDLLAMAKDLDVAMIPLSQLNRAAETRTNNRPTMSDLRDSGAIEQDADVICTLFRPAYYLERKAKEDDLTDRDLAEARANKTIIEVDVQKNRNGKTGLVKMFCDPGANAIRDLGPDLRSVAA
jgi:replicative DNA helicase